MTKISKGLTLAQGSRGLWVLEESKQLGRLYCCSREEFVYPTIVKVKLFIREGCILIAVLDPIQRISDIFKTCKGSGKHFVRATSFLCLVGIGLGLGSLLLYRLCTRLFSPAIPPPNDKKKRPSSPSETQAFPEKTQHDKLSPETPDSGITADMGNQEGCEMSVPPTPQTPEGGVPGRPPIHSGQGPLSGGLRYRRGYQEYQEREGFVFVNKMSSRPSSMQGYPSSPGGASLATGLTGHGLVQNKANSDVNVMYSSVAHKGGMNVSQQNQDIAQSFVSTATSDLGFYSGHFADNPGGRRAHYDSLDFVDGSSSFQTFGPGNGTGMQDLSFTQNVTNSCENTSALGLQGPMNISTQSLVSHHSTPNTEGAPLNFTYMSSCGPDSRYLNNGSFQSGVSPGFYEQLDNSGNMNYANYHSPVNGPTQHSTPDTDVQNNNRHHSNLFRFGQRVIRRPSSANNTCWPPQRGDGGSMTRNKYSFSSDMSGSSDYSVSQALLDKGYSIDLGENLSGLDTPNSDMFEAQDVGGGTVSNIELIQNQLEAIRHDIEDMNTKVTGLNSREDISRDCYTLGCVGSVDLERQERQERLRVMPRRRRQHSGSSYRSRSSSLDRTSEDINADYRRSVHHQGEFIWDYQSDLAQEDNQFVARRPMVGASVFSSDDSGHSRSQSPKLEHIKKYLESSQLARSPGYNNSMDRSHTINSIGDLYIDDEYSGLAAQDPNANPGMEDVRLLSAPHHYERSLRPSPPGRACSPGAPGGTHNNSYVNDLNSRSSSEKSSKDNSYHSPKLKVHHNICPSCSSTNVSQDASTSTSRHASPDQCSRVRNAKARGRSSPLCDNCSPVRRPSPPHSTRASPPGSLSKPQADKKWMVVNIAEKCNLYEYAATEWKGETTRSQTMKKGYHQIPGILNKTHIRRVRGDNYCALRSTLYQALVNNIPILRMVGTYEQVNEKLGVFQDFKHCYLQSWSFANRLPFSKENLVETLRECLQCLYQKVKVVSSLSDYAAREEYVLSLLNQNPDVDIKLLEAVKLLMMLKAISLHEDYTGGRNTPVFAWLLFARDTSETPEGLFRNHINVLGDAAGLEQIEMFLLGHTLGVKIEVVRPSQVGQEDFISHYPDEGADGFPKVYLIAEDDRHYNVITT